MTDIEKLRTLIPHWVEHNTSHGDEFHKWSRKATDAGDPQIARYVVAKELLTKHHKVLNEGAALVLKEESIEGDRLKALLDARERA